MFVQEAYLEPPPTLSDDPGDEGWSDEPAPDRLLPDSAADSAADLTADPILNTEEVTREKLLTGDPFENAALREDVTAALEQVLLYIRYTSQEQRERLRAALNRLEPEEVAQFSDHQNDGLSSQVGYGAAFNLVHEVEAQIAAVRAVRDTVLGSDGRILAGTSSREAKEVIASGSTLINTLMKFHTQVVNMDRIRKLEASVVEVLKEADPEIADAVLERLEQRLESE